MMTMNTSSPFKTLFVTLYLLNNTFNENLLFDKQLLDYWDMKINNHLGKENQGMKFESQNNSNMLPLLQIPSSCPRNRASVQDFDTGEGYNSPMQMSKQKTSYQNKRGKLFLEEYRDKNAEKGIIHKDALTSLEPNSREYEESNCFHNETIINQKNIYIILTEPTKSSIRHNYSQALNEVARGGKGAIEILTNVIKNRVNNITTTPASDSTYKNEKLDIPQNKLKEFLNKTNQTCNVSEDTTLGTFLRNSSTNANRQRTFTSSLEESSTGNDLSYLLSPLNQVTATGTLLKNISEIYAKSVRKILSSTTIKQQTRKIIIPCSSDASVATVVLPTMETKHENFSNFARYSTNITANVFDALKTRNKHIKAQSINITTNDSAKNIDIGIPLSETPYLPVFNPSNSRDSFLKENNSSNETKKGTSKSANQAKYHETECLPSVTQTITTGPKSTIPQKKRPSLENETSTNAIECSNSAEYDDNDVKNDGNSKRNKKYNEYYKDRSCDVEQDANMLKCDNIKFDHEIPNTLRPTVSCISTRRQKSTTLMLPQKIFSPTLIQCGKHKNGSMLVIKLLSETSEKPLDLAQYVRKIKLGKLSSRLRHYLKNSNFSSTF